MPRLRFSHHLLLAGAFLLVALGVLAARHWGTVSTMIDNATALNEGRAMASEIRSPDDLLDYLAAHPEQASLVAYDVDAPETGVYHRADSVRVLAGTQRILLLAEYARQVAIGRIDPDRRVSVDSVSAFALPGITVRAPASVDSVWTRDRAEADVTVRYVAERIVANNDAVASDWLWTVLGPENVRSTPARLEMTSSTAPQSASGRYLAWTGASFSSSDLRRNDTSVQARLDAAVQRTDSAHWTRTARFTHRLRTEPSFRRRVRTSLSENGTGLRLRQQRRLAQATGVRGTASDYAALSARIAGGRLDPPAASRHLQALLERDVSPGAADSVQLSLRTIAVKAGVYPGVLSAAGYARREDGATCVVAFFMDGVPLAVLYHLVQTGIDKGFLVQLLGDDAFFQRVRERMDGADAPPAQAGADGPRSPGMALDDGATGGT